MKGYTVPRNTSIGKCTEDDQEMMYPNTNFMKFFPSEGLPETKEKTCRSGCLRAGTSAEITLDELGLIEKQKFSLHYDFGDDWMFVITVKKISEVAEKIEPRIIKSKGNIQQYPDWDEWGDE